MRPVIWVTAETVGLSMERSSLRTMGCSLALGFDLGLRNERLELEGNLVIGLERRAEPPLNWSVATSESDTVHGRRAKGVITHLHEH